MTSFDLGALGRLGQALERTVSTDRLSPSYLFEGADGETVRQAALAFAELILGADAPDGERPKIARLVEEGTHPDLHLQGKDKATVISVSALTAVLDAAHGAPVAGRRQVFVIDPAEAMEPEGIARYLKALEEPPAGTVFVLVSTKADRLPETVLSRVQRIRIPPVSADTIARRLREEGCGDEEAADLARWAGGSMTRARRLHGAGVPDVVRALLDAATSPEPRIAATVESVLASLSKEAAALAESSGETKPDRKREGARVLLTDILHVLTAEARDAVAGRPRTLLLDADADTCEGLLTGLGGLSAAVYANVTPAVLLAETARLLQQALRPVR